MSRLIIYIFTALLFSSCLQQNQKPESGETSPSNLSTNNKYDESLAKELGADDYGMAQYVMAFLKKGPNRTTDEEEAAKLQRAHMENIGRLAEEGKLAIAGPFLDDGELRGIYIFNVATIEEAAELTKTDPAIQAGSLVMELHPWYGSAGLKAVREIHEKIGKIEI